MGKNMPWMIQITPIQSLKNSIIKTTVQNIKTKIDVDKSLEKSTHWKKLTSEKKFESRRRDIFKIVLIILIKVSETVLCKVEKLRDSSPRLMRIFPGSFLYLKTPSYVWTIIDAFCTACEVQFDDMNNCQLFKRNPCPKPIHLRVVLWKMMYWCSKFSSFSLL